jgi:predicted MPP superfamily phosphohydrolase
MLVRLLIFLLVLVALDLYAFQAIRTITKNQWIHWTYFLISIGVLGYLVYQLTSYDRSVGPTKGSLAIAGLTLLVYVPKIILLITMFGEDIIRLFVGAYNYLSETVMDQKSGSYIPGRRAFVSKIALGVAAIPFTSLLYGMFKGKYNFKVLTHTLYFDDLPEAFDGFKMTQISDIHSGSFDNPEKIEYAVDLINEQETDVIFFTGDIVNTKAEEMDPWIDTFKRIKNPTFGKHSVLGNHDYGEYVTWPNEEAKEANFQAIKDIHKKIDFNLLLNDSAFLEKEGQRLAVVGVENWGHNFKKAGDLSLASKNIDANDFKILLSHDPSHWEYEVKNAVNHYHLTLSGHTHGFQFGIEIPGFLKWSPVQYVYKQWAGMYQEFGKYVHVNRGFGFHAYPGRVGIWPEITVIELKRGSNTA